MTPRQRITAAILFCFIGMVVGYVVGYFNGLEDERAAWQANANR